jgi:multiple sugar transport system permease protein
MLNPEWGVINTLIFRLTGDDGPNWLNDPALALSLSMVVHIWKSLPFWTLILLAGRLAIPHELYEAASVDGAGRWHGLPLHHLAVDQHALRHLHAALDDLHGRRLQQRLPADRRRPADLTHVLATLGIRYLRLDQVGLAMASIVCALPLILPLVFFMMKRLSK